MRAIIIDDKAKCRALLHTLLLEYVPTVKVVAQAENVALGADLIKNNNIELVFLDVEMPGEDGFQLLNYFENPTFEIIFTTAHPDYALKAFEVAAIGYLLKPIQIEKLMEAVDKAVKIHKQSQIHERLATLSINLKANEIQKIALPVSDGILFVNVKDIILLKADGAYTHIFLKNEKQLLISKNLKEFETMLEKHSCFFRSHRSFIINIYEIEKYNKSEGGFIELTNGYHADISRDKKEELEKALKMVS